MKWYARSFRDQELPKIEEFFLRQFRGGGLYGSAKLFAWKILLNHNERGLINLVLDEEEIISTTSLTPKSFIFKGEKVRAGEIGDTYTDEKYKRQGLFALLVNQTRTEGSAMGLKFIYGTPNNQSLPGYQKKANFNQISNLNIRSMSFFCDLTPYLKKLLPSFLAIPLGALYKLGAALYINIRYIFRNKSYQISNVQILPTDWNTFWHKSASPYESIFDRSKEALTWRYFQNPNSYRFDVISTNGLVSGYIVSRIVEENSRRNLVIADYLCLPGFESALDFGLRELLKLSKSQGLCRVILWCVQESPYFSVFKNNGFKTGPAVTVICYQDEFAKEINEIRKWHFTIGDSDNI